MTQEELHCSEVFGPSVDQRGLGPPQRVCRILTDIETDTSKPSGSDPSILPGGEMICVVITAREKEISVPEAPGKYPLLQAFPGQVGNLELNRPLGLLLQNGRPLGDSPEDANGLPFPGPRETFCFLSLSRAATT